ncbi:unnamed protein product [Ostreobium quekettii]|uniref:Uncharacterized protein n=1 Tax=Ostreobium quekettii TaxID=121088 RepID=A0A8S1IPC4_9CHLO|nr:unnamed protein product [Ostreobium quekettii]
MGWVGGGDDQSISFDFRASVSAGRHRCRGKGTRFVLAVHPCGFGPFHAQENVFEDCGFGIGRGLGRARVVLEFDRWRQFALKHGKTQVAEKGELWIRCGKPCLKER